MRRGLFTLVAICILLGSAEWAGGQEPVWTGRVLKVGPERAAMEATPIELRPYRPLHFYGNAVRRQYYRGTPLPAPRDFIDGAQAFFRNR